MVVADSRALAEDAAELVEVDYEPLPRGHRHGGGRRGRARPCSTRSGASNVALEFKTGFGDAEARARAPPTCACASASTCSAMSACRSRRAGWSPSGIARDGSLTTWNGTQVVHFVQQGLVAALGLPAHKIRVIAPDVGGGFGTKANGYPEDLLIPAAAIACAPAGEVDGGPARAHDGRRPCARTRCTTSRSAPGATAPCWRVRDRIWVDLGAYNSWGIVLPYNTVAHLLGPHRVPNLDVECRGVVTNKTPNAPYRGAGRPETVFAMDRIVDCLARELAHGSGRAAAEELSLPPPTCPTSSTSRIATATRSSTTAATSAPASRRRSSAVDYDGASRASRPSCATRGIYRGIGISGYVEGTAIGPYEGATVRMDASGPRGGRHRAPAARGRGTRPRSPRSRPTRSASRSTG